ncbi:hypothetical protein ACRRTK_003717 [Alexandromys fortis]
MHWVLVQYLMGHAQGYTCLEERTPLPNPQHNLRKATVALKRALSNAFQDSSGTEATESRLEKIKRLGPEGRDQGREAAQWAGRSDVSDDWKQDRSSLWLWSEGQWGRGKTMTSLLSEFRFSVIISAPPQSRTPPSTVIALLKFMKMHYFFIGDRGQLTICGSSAVRLEKRHRLRPSDLSFRRLSMEGSRSMCSHKLSALEGPRLPQPIVTGKGLSCPLGLSSSVSGASPQNCHPAYLWDSVGQKLEVTSKATGRNWVAGLEQTSGDGPGLGMSADPAVLSQPAPAEPGFKIPFSQTDAGRHQLLEIPQHTPPPHCVFFLHD